jgi:hypothetical protein
VLACLLKRLAPLIEPYVEDVDQLARPRELTPRQFEEEKLRIQKNLVKPKLKSRSLFRRMCGWSIRHSTAITCLSLVLLLMAAESWLAYTFWRQREEITSKLAEVTSKLAEVTSLDVEDLATDLNNPENKGLSGKWVAFTAKVHIPNPDFPYFQVGKLSGTNPKLIAIITSTKVPLGKIITVFGRIDERMPNEGQLSPWVIRDPKVCIVKSLP